MGWRCNPGLPTQSPDQQLVGPARPGVDCHQRNLEIRQELGDWAGIGATLGNLGNTHWHLGHYAGTRPPSAGAGGLVGDRGPGLCTPTGPGASHPGRGPHALAISHHGLATARHASGDHDAARRHWSAALDLYIALGTRQADEVRAHLSATAAGLTT